MSSGKMRNAPLRWKRRMLFLQRSAWVSALSLAVNDDAAVPQRKKRRFAMQCKVVLITLPLSSIKPSSPFLSHPPLQNQQPSPSRCPSS